MPFLQKNDIFHMLSVREHVDRLHLHNFISRVEQLEVAGLSGRIAAYIHDAFGGGKQDGVNDILMHAGTWRVGDDDIGRAFR